MEFNVIDLQRYFSFLGLEEYKLILPEPSLDTLQKIVERHALKVPFQNVDFQTNYYLSKKLYSKADWDLSTLQKLILDRRRGAICSETHFLLEAALSAIGFKVQFLSAAGMPYHPDKRRAHCSLLVEVESSYYLVDTTYSFYGARGPLKFDFNTQQETVLFDYEKYEIVVGPSYYQVNAVFEGKAQPLFYFLRENGVPVTLDREVMISDTITKMYSDEPWSFRDGLILIGGPTEDGRSYHWWNYKEQKGYLLRRSNYLSKEERAVFKDFTAFKESVDEVYEIKVPMRLQKMLSLRPKL